jgi:hypothetical protein
MKTKICPTCKKEFKLNSNRQKFCSLKCSAKSPNHFKCWTDEEAVKNSYNSIKNYYLGKHGVNYQFGKVKKVCQICNKEYETYKKNSKFCSHKCWAENLKKHPTLPNLITGENFGFKKGNTYWRNNKNKYHKGWIKLGDKKYWYDSSFEKEAMKIMFNKKIKFIRDYKADLGPSIMFIDFYLPKYNRFVEAKGYFRKDAINKIKKFEKLYNQKIDVIQAQYTKDFCSKFKNYLGGIL